MPATHVTPQLRRELSNEARRALVNVMGQTDPSCVNVRHLPLPARLAHCRAQVRLEIPSMSVSAHVMLIVSGTDYCYRYQMAGTGADLCVLNKSGTVTKWILHSNGMQEQLRTYLEKLGKTSIEREQISSYIDLIELVDLTEVFRASQSTIPIGVVESSSSDFTIERFVTGPTESNESTYLFEINASTGQPVMITQQVVKNSSEEKDDDDGSSDNLSSDGTPKLVMMIIEEYLLCDEELVPPAGILSDVEIMVNTAMEYFTHDWLPQGQKYIEDIFDEIDKDGDGFVSGSDVAAKLEAAGQAPENAMHTSMEMVRLLRDGDDPSEEFDFHKFCGFWMAMLVDGTRVTDPSNQVEMIKAFRQLFCGEVYFTE